MTDERELTWDEKQARLKWEEFERRQADQFEQMRQAEEARNRQREHFAGLQNSRFGYNYYNFQQKH